MNVPMTVARPSVKLREVPSSNFQEYSARVAEVLVEGDMMARELQITRRVLAEMLVQFGPFTTYVGPDRERLELSVEPSAACADVLVFSARIK